MKKLLLASAVLVGMGASQAFAADTDSWTGTITAIVEDFCAIEAEPDLLVGGTATAAANIADGGTGALTATELDLADDNGYLNTGLVIGIEFAGDSVFCNYAHNFTVMSSLGGFASVGETSTPSTIGTNSDAFQTRIPHQLNVDRWEASANGTNLWSNAKTIATVGPANEIDSGDYALNNSPTAGGGDEGSEVTLYQENSVPAFHNDGIDGGGAGTSTGLLLELALQDGNGSPLLSGLYTDKIMLKIGGGI